MKFSICSPVYYDKEAPENERQPRYEMFLRCASSVLSQTFDDWQWVIVDDICNPPVEEVLKDIIPASKLKVVRLPEKGGRMRARNQAMEAAEGEWITWLDADDEYSSLYLQAFNEAINLFPEYKAFNCNHLVFHYDYQVSVRKFLNMETIGDSPFGSGTIGAGAYIFHKSVFEDIGPIPEKGLWDFADHAFEEFPEIKPFFWVESLKSHNSLGNPWGEDYYYFYKLTRKYQCKYLDTALYFVHSHFDHRWPENPDYLIGEGKKPEWNPKIR